MNKKGIITVVFFIAGLFGLTLSYIIFTSSEKQGIKEGLIGSKQSELIQLYLKSEEIMLNIEQSAGLSQAKALDSIYKNPGCGLKDNYIILDSCNLEETKVEKEYLKHVKNELKNYLSQLQKAYAINLSEEDYTLTIEESNLIGGSNKPIALKTDKAVLNLKPDFKIKLDLDTNSVIAAFNSLKSKKNCLVTYNELEGEKKLIERCDLKEFDAWTITKKDKDLLFSVKKNTQSIFNSEIDTRFTINF